MVKQHQDVTMNYLQPTPTTIKVKESVQRLNDSGFDLFKIKLKIESGYTEKYY